MEIQGRIKLIKATEQKSTKFKKRDFVVTVDENTDYPQYISIQFTQDKCDLLNKYVVGDLIITQCNLRGRLWINNMGEEVYFNSIEAWKIDKLYPTNPGENQNLQIKEPATTNNSDDLPF